MFSTLFGGFVILCIAYRFILRKKSCYSFFSKDEVILLVIAHPDDECMFFAPAILNLLKQGCEVYLLCLSSGGFYQKSAERKSELRKSCQILGIPSHNVFIIDHSKLPDNPDFLWNKLYVANIIRKYFVQLSAKAVISFDEYGISGHLNHIAIHNGMMYLKKKNLLPQDGNASTQIPVRMV